MATDKKTPRTRHVIADEINAVSAAIDALCRKGGDALKGLTDAETGELAELDKQHEALTAELASKPDPIAIKARYEARGGDGSFSPRQFDLGGRDASGGNADPVKGRNDANADRIDDGESEFEKYLRRGPFKSLGHFACVTRAYGARHPNAAAKSLIDNWFGVIHKSDAAIKAAYGDIFSGPDALKAITGLGEFLDSEGGLLVPIDFSEGIYRRAVGGGVFLPSLCQGRTVTGNTWVQRAYADDSRATGSRMGGVVGYWIAEGGQYTGSRPTFRTNSWRLNKLTVMVYQTEEMLEDVGGIESELTNIAGDEIRFQANNALIRGGGVGEPLGLLNSGAKIAAASNNGANTTISATDIDNMWVRRAEPNGIGYVWLGNQEIETQLAQAKYLSGSTPYTAVWTFMPPGGVTGGLQTQAVPAVIKGKPLIYNEFCEALGTEGDIILFDPTQYFWVTKAAGIKSSMSMHLRFDYDEMVFKFSYRCDGRCAWDRALTRFKGGSTLSPIITLETNRAS